VGIWERRQCNGKTVFVRDEAKRDEWHNWANVGQISPKGSARRIVLLGESVARGYLYDPSYNPATVLAKILELRMGRGEVEVIDLARTSMGLEIRDLALSAAVLEPDVVVLFCGNNWRYELPKNPADAGHLATAVRERGAAGYKEHAEEIVRGRAEEVIGEISSFYAEKGVPLLWIAPEFNLGDWRDPVANAPHLPDDGNRLWMYHRETAQTALSARDFDTAANAARRMIELDHGTSAAGYYLLADCARATGDLEVAGSALESARDAHIWDPAIIYAPRSGSPVLEALRKQAGKHGNTLVDSPELFKDYLDGEIPGRRLFIDYCHLTSEGIRVTMAAAASAFLRSLKEGEIAWRDLLVDAPEPSAKTESETYFLAAVHNAHWWQGRDQVEYYVAQSFQRSQHITPVMAAFLELQTRRAPLVMCSAAEQILKSGSPQIQHYLFGYNRQCLDPLLTDAIAKSLKGIDAGVRRRVDRLRIEEHAVGSRQTDLLAYYYNSSTRQPHEVEWVKPGIASHYRNYYKAFSPRSRFIFVGEYGRPAQLDITWRIPYPARVEETVSIYVNDEHIGDMVGGAEWGRYEIPLPGNLVRDGLNEIALQWPSPNFPGIEAIEKISDDVLAGEMPDPYYSFGDVHAFTASPVHRSQKP
jgi:hypothetical protein